MNQRIRASVLIGFGMLLGLLAPYAWGAVASQAQSSCQSFPQTGHQICGRFLQYWQQHGGLAQQGYPLSEEFVETSALNGKPYTVQYFERAVFELHPENAPPYDVLLSQLGTFQGRANYPQGFPPGGGVPPYYNDQTSPANTLKSFHNGITRKEYERAYGYYQGAPNPDPSLAPPYNQWVQGYSTTAASIVAYNPNYREDPGAGNVYAAVRAAVRSLHTNGAQQLFSGCYIMHRVAVGVSPNPDDLLWHISRATVVEAPVNTPIDSILAQPCNP